MNPFLTLTIVIVIVQVVGYGILYLWFRHGEYKKEIKLWENDK